MHPSVHRPGRSTKLCGQLLSVPLQQGGANWLTYVARTLLHLDPILAAPLQPTYFGHTSPPNPDRPKSASCPAHRACINRAPHARAARTVRVPSASLRLAQGAEE
ncbi:unnamed protein product [Protopolystoma xenopodis]|uniref:Uncharacterized protein n=1 Tax=Protopolystoma xenopodis TaxID=117903 RepID=A0A448X6R8_9PLAT|nr:unnamed protein product [Protopolystoma xenopodis]